MRLSKLKNDSEFVETGDTKQQYCVGWGHGALHK